MSDNNLRRVLFPTPPRHEQSNMNRAAARHRSPHIRPKAELHPINLNPTPSANHSKAPSSFRAVALKQLVDTSPVPLAVAAAHAAMRAAQSVTPGQPVTDEMVRAAGAVYRSASPPSHVQASPHPVSSERPSGAAAMSFDRTSLPPLHPKVGPAMRAGEASSRSLWRQAAPFVDHSVSGGVVSGVPNRADSKRGESSYRINGTTKGARSFGEQVHPFPRPSKAQSPMANTSPSTGARKIDPLRLLFRGTTSAAFEDEDDDEPNLPGRKPNASSGGMKMPTDRAEQTRERNGIPPSKGPEPLRKDAHPPREKQGISGVKDDSVPEKSVERRGKPKTKKQRSAIRNKVSSPIQKRPTSIEEAVLSRRETTALRERSETMIETNSARGGRPVPHASEPLVLDKEKAADKETRRQRKMKPSVKRPRGRTKVQQHTTHARQPLQKKRRMSEVLRLQKALETAVWTDSAVVQKQTEIIVVSDDETPVLKAKAAIALRQQRRSDSAGVPVPVGRAVVKKEGTTSTHGVSEQGALDPRERQILRNGGARRGRISASEKTTGTTRERGVASRDANGQPGHALEWEGRADHKRSQDREQTANKKRAKGGISQHVSNGETVVPQGPTRKRETGVTSKQRGSKDKERLRRESGGRANGGIRKGRSMQEVRPAAHGKAVKIKSLASRTALPEKVNRSRTEVDGSTTREKLSRKSAGDDRTTQALVPARASGERRRRSSNSRTAEQGRADVVDATIEKSSASLETESQSPDSQAADIFRNNAERSRKSSRPKKLTPPSRIPHSAELSLHEAVRQTSRGSATRATTGRQQDGRTEEQDVTAPPRRRSSTRQQEVYNRDSIKRMKPTSPSERIAEQEAGNPLPTQQQTRDGKNRSRTKSAFPARLIGVAAGQQKDISESNLGEPNGKNAIRKESHLPDNGADREAQSGQAPYETFGDTTGRRVTQAGSLMVFSATGNCAYEDNEAGDLDEELENIALRERDWTVMFFGWAVQSELGKSGLISLREAGKYLESIFGLGHEVQKTVGGASPSAGNIESVERSQIRRVMGRQPAACEAGRSLDECDSQRTASCGLSDEDINKKPQNKLPLKEVAAVRS